MNSDTPARRRISTLEAENSLLREQLAKFPETDAGPAKLEDEHD